VRAELNVAIQFDTPTRVARQTKRKHESVRPHAHRADHSTRPASAGREHRVTRSHVVVENIFRNVLIREKKRAERARQQLLLVSVSIPDDADRDQTWPIVVESLAAATRETDITGWLESGRTMSVILSGVAESPASLAAAVRRRVQDELTMHMRGRTVTDLGVDVSVHPAQKSAEHQAAFSPMPAIDTDTNERRSYRAAKRALDVLCSLALLAILAPVFLVVAALVKLTSRGPVFFRQSRIGYQAKPFSMLKFRTMRVDADQALHQEFVTNFIKSGGRQAQPDGQAVFKIAKDPRVTSIGRILRKTSIDELPQFWNVVRGDMSLVGPRPPLHYEVEQYEPWHRRRLFEAKPGITGLWQVTGRSRTTFDDMVRLDLKYVKTCSISTDVKILLATPGAVISGKGAC
jgi:exopolysaccharide biosynthesis polyprenyl glycosylphosphotransferase